MHRSIHQAARLALAAGILAAPLAAASAQTEQPDGTVRFEKEPPKQLSPIDQRRQTVNWFYSQRRLHTQPTEVIYGADDRLDIYQVTDPVELDLAQAAAVVVSVSELTFNGDGTVTLSTAPWTTVGFGTPLCPDEPFAGQATIGFCSGFLVGTDLGVSAGHCIDDGDVNAVAFVFNFDQQSMSQGPDTIVPEDDVYIVTEVIDQQLGGGLDHALVRFDRPVSGYTPIPIRRSGEPNAGDNLIMIGHPVTLPKKVDAGGQVQDPLVGDGFFTANVDAYGGNSGSMVYNATAGFIEGILVRGNPDFVTSSGCGASNVCPDTGCPGFEEVSKVVTFQALVPPLGAQVSPPGDQLHLGLVGGPFTNNPVGYTIENTTSDVLNYRVSVDLGGTAPLLLNGGTADVTGSLGAGATTGVEVFLDPSITGFAAGTYASTVRFEDLTNGVISTRTHIVEVGTTGIEVTPLEGLAGSGPVGGPFPATMTYTVTSTRPSPVDVQVFQGNDWIAVDGSTAPANFTLIGIGDSRNVEIGFSMNADLLDAGFRSGFVDFTNASGGSGSTSRTVTLDVGRVVVSSSDTPIPIVDNSEIQSIITIIDPICVADVDVEIDITHTFSGDLIIDLVSPDGTVVRLRDRTGGSDDDVMTTYDDATMPPDGPGMLSDFNGTLAQGDWTLIVSDNAGLDEGTLNAWALRLGPDANPCPPVAQDFAVEIPTQVTSDITLLGSSASGTPEFVITSLPANATLSDPNAGAINAVPYTLASMGDTVRYTPDAGFAGDDSFEFQTFDGQPSDTATASVRVGITEVVYDFPLDSDPGWDAEGDWDFGPPDGGGSNNGDPFDAFTGFNVWGYNRFGDYDDNMIETNLTTGPLDLSGVVAAELRFARWLAIESSTFDNAAIDISTDGDNWTRIWQHDDGSVSPIEWETVSYDISAIADGQSAVRIRWVMGTTDGSVTYPGWNIDDVQILGIQLPSGCPADLTGSSDPNDPTFGQPDGDADGEDFFFYLDAFVAQNLAVCDLTGRTDPNDPTFGVPDGDCDGDDFFFYLDLFVQGCP